jgi:hypothetical protein
MKSLTLRSSVALACALSLAGCGGGSGNLLLGGTITGLSKDGLVLQNNGGTPLAVAAGSQVFSFPDLLRNDQDFNVTIQSAPASAVCTIANGKGKTGAFNVTSVVVHCITNSYELGGTISGLGGASGLVLVNGADRQEISAGATSFTMTRLNADGSYSSGKVGDGSPYGVTILTQPAGRSCTVLNGVGTMGAAPVNNVQVNCS